MSLGDESRETHTLLRRLKREVAEQIVNGKEVPISDLAAISQLEIRLSSLMQFERLRLLTSRGEDEDEGPQADAD